MRLTKIHVDGFGKLSDVTLTMSSGFQVIYGDNEAGKSTLCAFLTAMFYSMPNDRKNASVRENLRARYLPWNGGAYGGSVELVDDGGTAYRIERVFGENRRRDKLTVRDCETWEVVALPDDEPGRTFFGIGREAFLNTLCTGQMNSAVERRRDDELLALLAGLDRPDGSAYAEKAERALQAARVAIQTDAGRAGALVRLEQEIAARKDDRERAAASLDRYRDDILERNRLRARADALRRTLGELDALKAQSARYEDYRTYRRLTDELRALEARLSDGKWEQAKRKAEDAKSRLDETDRFDAVTQQTYVDAAARTRQIESLDEREAAARDLAEAIAEKERERDGVYAPKPINIPMLAVALAVVVSGVLCGLLVHPLLWALVAVGAFLAAVSALTLRDSRDGRRKRDALDRELDALRQEYASVDRDALARDRQSLVDARDALYARLTVRSDQEILDGIARRESLRQSHTMAVRELELLSESRAQTEADARRIRESRDALHFTAEELDQLARRQPPESLDRRLAETNDALLECATALRAAELRTERAAESETLASLDEEISRLEERRDALRLRHAALTLALDTLRDCVSRQKSAVAPALSENVRAMLYTMSGGRYDNVRVADDYSIAVRQAGTDAVRDADVLSDGARDMTHLALRLGLIRTVLPDRAPLLLLDDSFAQYDAGRVRQSRAAFADAFPDAQVLYFTCHESLRALLPDDDWLSL